MDIHKPKPWHGWRGFLKEVGTIVLGVCIALAAEQGVETLHNRGKAAEARASIRAEIARNLGRMNVRQAVEACIAKRLDEVDELISASVAGKLPQGALWIGIPTSLSLFDSSYRAAMQSGTASLFATKEQRDYANLYSAFDTYMQAAAAETRAWGDLRTLERRPASSATLDWQLRSAMQQARTARYSIDNMDYFALSDGWGIGIRPSQQPKLRLAAACVPLHTRRNEAVKLLEAARGRKQPMP
jgi:hypothetical protein